jgi:phospholipid/cholesterol/gamma-HCH transport system substrate-binding protein
MKRSVIETIMGGLVLLVALTFVVFAYISSDVRRVSGYTISAKFTSVGGLTDGSDVRMSGIKIGTVIDQELDPQTYLAIVRMSIDESIALPADTTAKIQSDGLLGNNYVALEPGGSDEIIEAGGEILYTQDAINLTDLIGRFMFGGGAPGAGAPGAGGSGGGLEGGADAFE